MSIVKKFNVLHTISLQVKFVEVENFLAVIESNSWK